jgi:hypothetical protein
VLVRVILDPSSPEVINQAATTQPYQRRDVSRVKIEPQQEPEHFRSSHLSRQPEINQSLETAALPVPTATRTHTKRESTYDPCWNELYATPSTPAPAPAKDERTLEDGNCRAIGALLQHHSAPAEDVDNAMHVDDSQRPCQDRPDTNKSQLKSDAEAVMGQQMSIEEPERSDTVGGHTSPRGQVKNEELTPSAPLNHPYLSPHLDHSTRADHTPQAEVKDEEADRLREAKMLAAFVRSTFRAPDVAADERGTLVAGEKSCQSPVAAVPEGDGDQEGGTRGASGGHQRGFGLGLIV